MEEAFRCGLEQAEKILQDICWEEYEDILFVSKSIGTVISSAFARWHQLSAKNILFTPLQQTFLFADGNGIVFHGKLPYSTFTSLYPLATASLPV